MDWSMTENNLLVSARISPRVGLITKTTQLSETPQIAYMENEHIWFYRRFESFCFCPETNTDTESALGDTLLLNVCNPIALMSRKEEAFFFRGLIA